MDKATTAAAMALPWWVILLAPATGGLIVGFILVKFQRGRRPHNVADVIEASAVGGCRISARDGFLSALISRCRSAPGPAPGARGRSCIWAPRSLRSSPSVFSCRRARNARFWGAG